MGWKRLEVGGQLGICCQRVQLTVAESVGEAAVYRDSREGESSKEKPGEMGRVLGTEGGAQGRKEQGCGPEAKPITDLPGCCPGAQELTSSQAAGCLQWGWTQEIKALETWGGSVSHGEEEPAI